VSELVCFAVLVDMRHPPFGEWVEKDGVPGGSTEADPPGHCQRD